MGELKTIDVKDFPGKITLKKDGANYVSDSITSIVNVEVSGKTTVEVHLALVGDPPIRFGNGLTEFSFGKKEVNREGSFPGKWEIKKKREFLSPYKAFIIVIAEDMNNMNVRRHRKRFPTIEVQDDES